MFKLTIILLLVLVFALILHTDALAFRHSLRGEEPPVHKYLNLHSKTTQKKDIVNPEKPPVSLPEPDILGLFALSVLGFYVLRGRKK